jgi:thiamine-monophosphate kinase
MSEESLLKDISSVFKKNNLIGDDCAIIPFSDILSDIKGENLLISTDTLIENVHFSFDYFSFEDVGYKSLAVNLSDIASCSGTPLFISISLGIPKKVTAENIKEIYRGIKILSDEFNIVLSGGDIVKSNQLIITVTIIGKSKNPFRRKKANAGDYVYVSGYLGASSYALSLFKNRVHKKSFSTLKHLRPAPRINLAKSLNDNYNITSCIDISDGLSTDLSRLLPDNLCGEIDFSSVPVHHEMKHLSSSELKDHILNGGEDFELLFTSPDDIKSEEVFKVGRVLKADYNVLIFNNRRDKLVSKGYDHLI